MQAYYINLARRTDRRATMETQFTTLGIAATRIEAATPAEVTDAQRALYCNRDAYRWQSEGELCCGLSHVVALRQFIDTGAPFALIVEDDAVLSPGLPGFLAEFTRLSPPLDLVRVETDNSRLRLPPEPEVRIGDFGAYPLHSDGGGSAGYIVSRQAAMRIVAGTEIFRDLTDRALFSPLQPLRRAIVAHQLSPALVIQQDRIVTMSRNDASDLERERYRRNKSDGTRFWARLHHNLRDFVRRDIVLAARNFWLARTQGVAKRQVIFKAN